MNVPKPTHPLPGLPGGAPLPAAPADRLAEADEYRASPAEYDALLDDLLG